jgi:hypothetical protein
MALAADHSLIQALRKSGGEVELTQALAAVFGQEPELARRFVEILVQHAPYGEAVAERLDLPAELNCYAEKRLEKGRADLIFTGEGAWHINVELKIHAGYGNDQISRYLDSAPAGDRSLVVAITRTVPGRGDRHDDPRWLGSMRWAELLPRLHTLVPKNDALRSQWPLFLDVLESEGSMGFTKADLDLFHAWGSTITARSHAEDFVEAVRHPIRDEVARLVIERGLETKPDMACAFETRGQVKRAVFPQLGKMLFRLQVPAGATPARIQAGLWGYGDPRFVVETPFPDVFDGTTGQAVDNLLAAGFRSWRDRVLEHFLRLDDALIGSAALQDEVIAFATRSVAAILDSGVLNLTSQDFAVESPEA